MGRKANQDPILTRKKILEVAFMEIYQKGYQGVGVRDIATKAELTIGAFFHHFPTKTHVAHAIIQEIIRTGIMERWIQPLSAYKNPTQGVLKCFKKTFDTWPEEYMKLGCPLNNLTQEMSTVDEDIAEESRKVIEDWISETEKQMKRAKENGFLKKSANPREIAEFIVSIQEGTFAMGKTLRSRRVYDSNYNALKAFLDSQSA